MYCYIPHLQLYCFTLSAQSPLWRLHCPLSPRLSSSLVPIIPASLFLSLTHVLTISKSFSSQSLRFFWSQGRVTLENVPISYFYFLHLIWQTPSDPRPLAPSPQWILSVIWWKSDASRCKRGSEGKRETHHFVCLCFKCESDLKCEHHHSLLKWFNFSILLFCHLSWFMFIIWFFYCNVM